MDCSNFRKASLLKRMLGVEGYCTFHQKEIKRHEKLKYYPFFSCMDKGNVEIQACPVQLCFEKHSSREVS